LRLLYDALSAGRRWLEQDLPEDLRGTDGKDEFALKAFTDNIVIAWPIERCDAESELGRALSALGGFQLQMISYGYFIRGAISIGDAYVDDIAVFGNALIEATEGEATLARDPRIVLTESAVAAAKLHLTYYQNNSAPHVSEILCDSDGQWFVNYLGQILWAEDVAPFFDELQGHKDAIETNLGHLRANLPYGQSTHGRRDTTTTSARFTRNISRIITVSTWSSLFPSRRQS
jgi:hypothetical protein